MRIESNNKSRSKLSRSWPQKKWKKAVVVVLVTMAVFLSVLEWSVFREVVTPIDVKNSSGIKTALVVYHPGLTTFPRDIAYAFADGLAANNWRVEIATASARTPTDLSRYDLLILSWPIYDFNPGPTVANYVHKIGNLQAKNTIVITVAGGLDPFNCPASMAKIVQDANGTITESLKAYRGGNAVSNIRDAASQIAP